MSAPLIWIVAPLLAAVGLWFLRSHQRLLIGLGVGFCLLLVVLASELPVAETIRLGSWRLEISTTLSILGRRFVLDNDDRPFLLLLYAFAAFWFAASGIGKVRRSFIPAGLGMIALLVAAVAVEPFLYAALLVETAVLLSIPILAGPQRKIGQGVIRYLIFQTLAMPFILFAGWAAAGVEANPSDQKLLQEAVFLLGLGFAFWLAVFPFYTWVPLLVEETNPYVAGFVLSLLPTVALLLILDFLNAFAWLRNYPLVYQALRGAGGIMVVTAGVWAGFQKDLNRLLGYAVILEIGFGMLALSFAGRSGLEMLVLSFVPRMLALAIWSLALAIIGEGNPVDIIAERGALRRMPVASAALVLACLSLSGLPILASFPIRFLLVESLHKLSPTLAGWVLVGILGFLIGGIRTLSVLADNDREPWQIRESWPQALLLVAGALGLIVIGLLPNPLLNGLLGILEAFENLR